MIDVLSFRSHDIVAIHPKRYDDAFVITTL